MRNERLIANAGSGKTYALTTRMIQLLDQGVDPSKIAALTFTRKSAGEFLSAVFERLAQAAKDPEKLADLRREPFLEKLDAARCRSLLKGLSGKIGCLGMGTIDSLFARIARAFPLESGLAEDFNMAGVSEIESARERTLATVFASESSASLHDFIDLVRRLNRSQGERNVFGGLLRETCSLHGKFLATPNDATWGDAAAIWGAGVCAILNAGEVAPLAEKLWKAIEGEHPQLNEDASTAWRAGLALAVQHTPPSPYSEDLKKFLAKLSNEKQTPEGLLYIPTRNAHAGRVFLSPSIRALRDELRNSLLKPEFEAALRRSQSLHEFMQKFEMAYSSLVRSAGLVTFADITDSLARKSGDLTWLGTAAYRIDQKFEHWLLDEFQDTSRPQWKILKTFLDEVLMDPSKDRSFFYVGDTKQAIYSWRGGDPDLFFEIFDDYNRHASTIQDAPPLDESWRSCQPILDFVNKAFSDLKPLRGPLEIPEPTLEKWGKAWANHVTSPKTRSLPGFAEWISVPKNDGDEDEDGDTQDRKILEILESTRAWERGLSCAVLKRDNTGVERLAGLLQSKDIPVAVEGKTNPCVDNPLGAAIIAALRIVASPDDALSHAVARGLPAISAWGVDDTPWIFRKKTLLSLVQNGYASTIRQWIESANLATEPFLRERAAAFLLAAEEFDALRNSSEGIPDFLRFIESRQTQENEASDVVRVMTVHQSKGLGFDMVIASGLDKKGRGNDGTNLALGPSAREVHWGLVLPAKEFAEQDAVLGQQLKIQEAEKKYGDICTAYVALTRAKKALYVVTTELGENTTSINFARHLVLQFHASSAQFGDPGWFADYEIKTPELGIDQAPSPFTPPLHRTPRPISPSSFKSEVSTGVAGDGVSRHAAKLGIEVHEALAEIEWLETSCADLLARTPEARKLVEEFLGKPLAREVFTKPEGPTRLWREQAFDIILDGQWVSGVFDRVVVHCDQKNNPLSAVIYDFKTDQGMNLDIQSRYAGQMKVYQKAVAKLLSIQEELVTFQIVAIR
ncbi:MAG: hypothetical protein RL630_808 [Verrucomicrobiota bacterium]|jgi:ATP-dependent helicase/nuclease subunit A